jgi:hypothetical protein
MKLTYHPIRRLGEIRRSTRHEINWLRSTSQNYRTTSSDNRGAPPQKPHKSSSFRSISDSFSSRERVTHFTAELVMFVVIALSAGASLYVCAVTLHKFLLAH